MKKLLLILSATVFPLGPLALAGQVTGFSDIEFWVGTGPNRAALVIDWQDDKNLPSLTIGQTLVWGFQWQNGQTPTGFDMLTAVAAADSRLHLRTHTHPTFGTYLFGLGYDLDGDGGTFSFTPAPTESGSASDPDDHLKFGFNTNGYWEYLNSTVAATSLPTNAQWDYAPAGAGDRLLANNTWDAWVFSGYAENPNFDLVLPETPPAAATVPEPSAGLLAASGLAAFLRRRRRA